MSPTEYTRIILRYTIPECTVVTPLDPRGSSFYCYRSHKARFDLAEEEERRRARQCEKINKLQQLLRDRIHSAKRQHILHHSWFLLKAHRTTASLHIKNIMLCSMHISMDIAPLRVMRFALLPLSLQCCQISFDLQEDVEVFHDHGKDLVDGSFSLDLKRSVYEKKDSIVIASNSVQFLFKILTR